MPTNLDVPKHFEIWIGGVHGLRLRRHPLLEKAKQYLAEYPWVVRSMQPVETTRLAPSDLPRITIETLPAFRESSVGPTVELRVEVDYPANAGQSIRFGRLILTTDAATLEENLVLRPGMRQSVCFPFPEFDKSVTLRAHLEVRDEGSITQEFSLAPENRWTWHVAFQTHLDLGWTDRAAAVIASLKKMTSQDAVRICREFAGNPPGKQFVWTCECSEALRYAWDGSDTSTRTELRALLTNKLIRCSVMPFTFHTGIMSRSLLQNAIRRSFRLRDEIGVDFDLSVAQQADVPGHNWVLPDLYAEAGIPYAIIDHNWLTRGCELPGLFRWRGPDGGEVVTMSSSSADYRVASGIPHQADDLRALSANPAPGNPGYGRSVPKGNALYSIIRYGENCGPEFAGREIAAIEAWQEEFSWPNLQVGGPEDYFGQLARQNCLDDLPVISQEISDWWLDGPASTPRATALFRRAMYQFDGFRTQTDELPDGLADDAADNLILFAEHTFGLNAGLVKATAAARDWEIAQGFEEYVESWRDKETYAMSAAESVRQIVASGQDARRDKNGAHRSWNVESDVQGIVKITGPSGICWVDRARTPSLPNFGTVFQWLLPAQVGSWFHYDTESAPNAGLRYGDVLSVTTDEMGQATIVTVEQTLPSPAGSVERGTLTVTASSESPALRCDLFLTGKEATAQSEAYFLALPFVTKSPRYRVDVGGRMLTVDRDQRDDSNRDGHAAGEGWVIEDPAAGRKLAVSSPEIFLWHYGGLRYCDFNRRDLPRTGDVYAHLFNNAWKTNFRCWIDGDFHYRFWILDLDASDDEGPALASLVKMWEVPSLVSSDRASASKV